MKTLHLVKVLSDARFKIVVKRAIGRTQCASAFPNHHLVMRRPFALAVRNAANIEKYFRFHGDDVATIPRNPQSSSASAARALNLDLQDHPQEVERRWVPGRDHDVERVAPVEVQRLRERLPSHGDA